MKSPILANHLVFGNSFSIFCDNSKSILDFSNSILSFSARYLSSSIICVKNFCPLSVIKYVEIVASIQDIKNQMGNDYFAKESLKLKCFDLPLLVELRDKKGKPLELPKSKYHR